MTRISRSLTLAALFALTVSSAIAQQYPLRPIRWIVPLPPGATADIITRFVAQKVGEAFGQQIVVDNRPGGVFTVGSEIVAKAPSDGYTVGTLLTPHVVNPFVMKNLPYNTERDFTPVSLMVIVPGVMTMHAGVPANNLKDVIALAKAKPGSLNYASASVASVGHLTGELLNQLAGIRMTHVAYKGSGQAVTDLLGGHIQLMFSGFSSVMPHIKSGKLRPIVQTGEKRSPALPDVPTIAESGFPKFEATAWYGVHAPAKTPKPIVSRLNSEFVKALKMPDVKERLNALGFELVGSTPEHYSAYIKSEIKKWEKVVKASGAKPE
jgi:tripartite-type tricarboxylate transporter receptor subunit TctC